MKLQATLISVVGLIHLGTVISACGEASQRLSEFELRDPFICAKQELET